MPNVKFEDNNYPKIEVGLEVVYRPRRVGTIHDQVHAGEKRRVNSVVDGYIGTQGLDGGRLGNFTPDEFWTYFEPVPVSPYPEVRPGLRVKYRDLPPEHRLHSKSGEIRFVRGGALGGKAWTLDRNPADEFPSFTIDKGDFWTVFRPVGIDDAFDAFEAPSEEKTPDTAVEIVAEVVAPEEVAEAQGDAIADSLRSWWLDVASQEVEPLISKMFEYGGTGRSNDLIRIGESLASAGVGGPGASYTEQALAELGIYFYIEGKMARWSAAIAEGRSVSDDTLLDIGIYVRMVQRIRAVGGWPV
ncbi:hypothetical protein [Curtobacterium phage Parvaparticeps]|nr:hypothetical protein [Curtobacterium phage Parvaparticeps]